MIDLTKKVLPSAVVVDGTYYKIKTDFRSWLRFSHIIKQDKSLLTDFDYLYEDKIPEDRQEGINALCDFYSAKNILPRRITNNEETECIVDYDIDSDFIYAAFYEQYGIDLLTVSLHWHIFHALFYALHTTKLNDIIGYRVYQGDDKELLEMRQQWELFAGHTEESKQAIEEFDALLK